MVSTSLDPKPPHILKPSPSTPVEFGVREGLGFPGALGLGFPERLGAWGSCLGLLSLESNLPDSTTLFVIPLKALQTYLRVRRLQPTVELLVLGGCRAPAVGQPNGGQSTAVHVYLCEVL